MQEFKLLGTLLPSMGALRKILERIREKYNIPPVLPEDEQLAETLRAERTPEEWRAVFADLEREIRAEIRIGPPELTKLLEGAVQIASTAPDAIAKESAAGGASNEALGRLAQQLITMVLPALELQDEIYKGLARRLLDYLITGRPIELPEELLNIVFRMTLAAEGEPEPVVIAVAHQLSNPDEITQKFRDKIVETFGEKPRIKEQHLELAEYLARKNTGKSIQENVELYLERHPDAITYRQGARRHNDEVKNMKNTMKVSLYRLQQMIDEITGYKKT